MPSTHGQTYLQSQQNEQLNSTESNKLTHQPQTLWGFQKCDAFASPLSVLSNVVFFQYCLNDFNVADIVAAFNFNTFFSNQSLHHRWRNIRPQRVSLLSHRDFDRGIWWMLSYPTFRRVTERILKFNFDHLPRKKTTHRTMIFHGDFDAKKAPRTSTQTSSRSRSIITSRIRSLAEERQLVVEDWFPPEQQSRFKYLISTVSWKLTD